MRKRTSSSPITGIQLRARVSIVFMVFTLYGAFPADSVGQVNPDTADSRGDAVAIIEELRKIHTPEGIEVLEQVELGGVPQWVSIRGRNRDNPVLLFIHGGPGDPMIGLSWAFQNPWEDYFTVVQWDQRGSGKNASTADREALRGTFTVDRLTRDAEELVAHLRERLGKEKVVVLGYSSGAVVGIHLAKSRPEWLHAYIGIGQVSHNFLRAFYDRTLEIAVAKESAEAVAELKSLSSYVEAATTLGQDPDPALQAIWKWANRFDGGWYGKGGWDLYLDLPLLAPEYSQEETVAAWDAMSWLGEGLWLGDGDIEYMNKRWATLDLRELGPRFEVPVLVFQGRYDLTPPMENARAYFDWIEAPHKHFVTFERSAHIPFIEEPGRFLVALLEHVLPLTEGPAAYQLLR
jgi:proline iminopeptidase